MLSLDIQWEGWFHPVHICSAGRNRVNAGFMPCVQRNGFQISCIWYLNIWNNFIKVNGSSECKLSGLLLCTVQGSSSFTLYFGDPSMHWRGNTTHSQLASRPDVFDASACSILPKYRVGILISWIIKIFYKPFPPAAEIVGFFSFPLEIVGSVDQKWFCLIWLRQCSWINQTNLPLSFIILSLNWTNPNKIHLIHWSNWLCIASGTLEVYNYNFKVSRT